MKLIVFRLKGRYGHFLRAEGGVSAPSYPVPPRTAVLGLLGAVLGLEKDRPQVALEPARIAVRGGLPRTHWHTAKFRQEPIDRLPLCITLKQRGRKQTSVENPKLIPQEWLFNPEYTIWCSIPEPWFTELEGRLRERRWHFQPCLGLSEMAADLDFIGTVEALALPEGSYAVSSVFPVEGTGLDTDRIFDNRLVVHCLAMPRTVTERRVFSHAAYYMERDSRPVPVRTGCAFEAGKEVILFL